MEKTWIIVANGSKARIFALDNVRKMHEIDGLVHVESRFLDRDMKSDRPGRSYDSFGGARHAIEREFDPHEQTMLVFAQQITRYLQSAQQDRKFDRLFLAASPHFLGLLRPLLNEQIKKAIVAEFDKDWTSLTPNQIMEHLPFAMLS